MTSFLLAVAALAAAPNLQSPTPAEGAAQVAGLRQQIALLEIFTRQMDARFSARLDKLNEAVNAQAQEIASLSRGSATVAAAFLAGPPPSSDAVGVAKVAVFAPKIEVDASRRHDNITLKVRRLEASGSQGATEINMGSDENSLGLPINQSGALYVVDWQTSEGQSYTLLLRDGATNQAAATVQVKPLQHEGRFIFVGYRLD